MGKSTRYNNDSRGTMPKVTVEDKLKTAILKILKIPEQGLEKAKVVIERDGKKIEVTVKTDIGKLKKDIFHLLHHKNFIKESINANTNTHDFTISVPPELVPVVDKLTDSSIDIDDRLEQAELKLKELGLNTS